MERYEIRCTESQTRKALELGAPIKYEHDCYGVPTSPITPTAEQMIGWLEEQGILEIQALYHRLFNNGWKPYIVIETKIIRGDKTYPSRQEATIAAIDAALYYLINNKK